MILLETFEISDETTSNKQKDFHFLLSLRLTLQNKLMKQQAMYLLMQIGILEIYIFYIQHDHVNFDHFVKFAVFIQNVGYFLF